MMSMATPCGVRVDDDEDILAKMARKRKMPLRRADDDG
jgi:hypothetical protein